ncbi:hypothetical protein [Methylobacterium nodulans]|uniref:Uncharacterized protein n=1 Tax=Methylobacterium nodulans (strain LMG 21967 / CNCM I-2342 / ORS 2060) TaxID=460265 RepID=B8IHU2_METNO|nr:hypothetical protein [Methylobacterium nodulans]ACL55980.1 conserved hypothetical protein [Methylobacterium nodulans ORS 2060]
MRTYALAFTDVLFACVPDDHDIDRVIEEEGCVGCAEIDPGEVQVVRGLVLTGRPTEADEVVWCAGPDGELIDERGQPFAYAVRRRLAR